MSKSRKPLSLLLIICTILAFVTAGEGYAQHNPRGSGYYLIDNFEDQEPGELPGGWYDRDGKHKLTEMSPESQSNYRYRVKRGPRGNRYLHYEGTMARHINYPLLNKKRVNLHETPILSWRWRVHDLPEGANEKQSGHNDAAASVYVVFDVANYVLKKLPVSIRYTWSTSLEVGTTGSKLFNKQKIQVVESGRGKLGEWITVERNLLEDYKRLHGGKPPKKPIALLIMSDGDSVNDTTSADYDDIMLRSGK